MLEQLNSCVAYLEKLRVGLQDAQFLKVKSQQVLSLTKRLRQNKRQCWRLLNEQFRLSAICRRHW